MLTHSLGLGARPQLQTSLSPRQQQGVRLLQMSSLDFSQVLRDALDTNPFLESDDDLAPGDAVPEPAEQATADEWDEEAPPEPTVWGDDAPLGGREPSPGAVFDSLEATVTLADHLIGQLKLLPLSERDLVLAAAVAGSLEDDGYLRCPLEEIGAGVELSPSPEAVEWQIALRRVQALEPAGVGARDLAECLRLQLPQVQPESLQSVAQAIVQRHLRTLATKDLSALARALGVDVDTARAACVAIRRMDPHPGWRHGQAPVPYLTPDVLVRRQRGQWVAVLNPAVVPRVRLNQAYAELLSQHREGSSHAELSAQLQEAKWTLRNVEQRLATILRVARAILKRQHRFLLYGPMAMRPLALRDIAQEVGVHESTVSRVTNNKYMATPTGVFELKFFSLGGWPRPRAASVRPRPCAG